MEKSQLVELLRTFDKREIRECKKWLRSPFHNQRQDVIDLYEYLFKGNSLYNEKKLYKKKVFSVIFPDESYDDSKIRQTMHFLLKTLEDYLIFDRLQRDEIRNKILLAEIYRDEKKLNKPAIKSIETAKNVLEKQKYRDLSFHLNDHLLKRKKADFAESGRFDGGNELIDAVSAYDRSYVANRFRDLCIMQQYKKINTSSFEEQIIQTLSILAEATDSSEYPAVQVYYLLYKVLSEQNEEYFLKLKEHFFKYRQKFNKGDQEDIFRLLINYCSRQMNSGKRIYVTEAFLFYKIGIEDEILINNKILDRYTFRNVVSAGVSLKEFEWVNNFIKNYQQLLKTEYRESYVNFCFGLLYYRSAQYNKAMKYLAQYEHDDILLNLNSKAMLIKMYYEQQEFIALESLLESAKVYLRRKKGVSESHRTAYSNILKYTSKILRVNPYDKEKKAKLREEIQAANPLIEKQWFLERLESL